MADECEMPFIKERYTMDGTYVAFDKCVREYTLFELYIYPF